ncbi:MAG TPA: fasciclin domain-containing protein [Ramlibacter sp.]|uniref:fasciclin domain-containing protein n=1 Tax=Ramlibacter sp. TaxID=1917967 RepID=UPI002C0B032F|nr:fasciclin domain-containing protein [Ramlibacter sp.]HVZ43102.1 fasciclin domain-containing protein [Ramlibacter sp.]
MKKRILLAMFAAAALGACATQPMAVSVSDTVARDPDLTTLGGLIARAGMTETLKAAGPYTLFAPTNEAFKAVPAKTMDELAHDPKRLEAVLKYHVLPQKLEAAQLKSGKKTTAEGAALELSRAGDMVTVEDAVVQVADVQATNGVVHKVDRVLLPPRR